MTYRTFRQHLGVVQHTQKAALSVLAAVLVSVFSLLPVAAASAATEASSAASASQTKAAPTAPAETPGVTAPDASKPQQGSYHAATLAWSVSLSASSTYLWPQQYTSLTATANANVGPTPYYISIYDATAGNYIKICGTGTVCSISVTQSTATTHSYRAYISTYPTTNPPANQQAVSATRTVTWRGVSVSLSASPTTTSVGGTSTLTATASADVTPSPFWIQIFDVTTGTRLNPVCGFSSTCSATVSQAAATTHKYVAYVSNLSTTIPPAGTQATSNNVFVTWANTGYRVRLSIASGPTFSQRVLTATSNVNVGPTPYYIEIFNIRTGTRLAVCGSGTTCTTTTSLGVGRNDFVAFISSFSSTLPPLNTQASSNVASASLLFQVPNGTARTESES